MRNLPNKRMHDDTLESNRGFHRLAAIGGVIGPVVFFVVVVIAGALYGEAQG